MTDPKNDKKPEAKQPEVRTDLQLQERAQETAAIASSVTQKTLEAILPELIASLRGQQQPQPGQRPVNKGSGRACNTCGWALFGQDAVKGECPEHELVVVYPQNEEFADFFVHHGIRVNGVKFASNHASHQIAVPKGLKDTLLHTLQEYERAEKEMRLGRTRQRQGGAGVVSGVAGVKQTPNNGWN